jgi:Tetratricopeptide repeat
LAAACLAVGRTADAVKMYEAVLKQQESTFSPDHPDTLRTGRLLIAAYTAAGQYTGAEPFLRGGLERVRKRLGPADPQTAAAMAVLGLNLFTPILNPGYEKSLNDWLIVAAEDVSVRPYGAQGMLGRRRPSARDGAASGNRS